MTPARSPLGAFYRSPLGVRGEGYPILLYWWQNYQTSYTSTALVSASGRLAKPMPLAPNSGPPSISGVYHVEPISGGKILITGVFERIGGQSAIKYLARATRAGVLDSTFDITSELESLFPENTENTGLFLSNVVEDSNGYTFPMYAFYDPPVSGGGAINLVRFSAAGVRDTSIGSYGGGNYLVVQWYKDKMWVSKAASGGYYCWMSYGLWEVSGDDPTWLDSQSVWQNRARSCLCKVTSSGMIDTNFAGATRVFDEELEFIDAGAYLDAATYPGVVHYGKRALVELSDGSILIAHDSTALKWKGSIPVAWSGTNRPVIKLSSSGHLVQDWLCPGSTYIAEQLPQYNPCLTLQPDGKVIVSGNFRTDGSYTAPAVGIFRLNADGTLDTSFDAAITSDDGFANMAINTILMPDGAIFVSFVCGYGEKSIRFSGTLIGPYTTYLMLNSDGSLRKAFTGIKDGGSPIVPASPPVDAVYIG